MSVILPVAQRGEEILKIKATAVAQGSLIVNGCCNWLLRCMPLCLNVMV
jgi:hypothetical protein